jgi:hypothetical protein
MLPLKPNLICHIFDVLLKLFNLLILSLRIRSLLAQDIVESCILLAGPVYALQPHNFIFANIVGG